MKKIARWALALVAIISVLILGIKWYQYQRTWDCKYSGNAAISAVHTGVPPYAVLLFAKHSYFLDSGNCYAYFAIDVPGMTQYQVIQVNKEHPEWSNAIALWIPQLAARELVCAQTNACVNRDEFNIFIDKLFSEKPI